MKRISNLIVLALFSSFLLTSCNDTTYAKELKVEQTLIEDFINRNGINVLSSFPTDNVWNDNDYVLTSSGLYFHLSNKGSDTISLRLNYTIVPRYIEYNLAEASDTTSHLSIFDDGGYTNNFVYGNYSQMCTAFHEAAKYMKYNDSEAKIIVHSKIGFQDKWSPATPMGYDLIIKIKK
jgi:hypothetical protein